MGGRGAEESEDLWEAESRGNKVGGGASLFLHQIGQFRIIPTKLDEFSEILETALLLTNMLQFFTYQFWVKYT